MTAFLRLDPAIAEPEISRPAPDRLVSGDPVFTSWTLEEGEGLYAGLWRATPGAWRVLYEEWEYCRIREGVSIVTEDGCAPVTVRAGDSFVLRPGFSGIWEVVETTLKDFVVRL
jgi:uncharacterized cupin superfamily protein